MTGHLQQRVSFLGDTTRRYRRTGEGIHVNKRAKKRRVTGISTQYIHIAHRRRAFVEGIRTRCARHSLNIFTDFTCRFCVLDGQCDG